MVGGKEGEREEQRERERDFNLRTCLAAWPQSLSFASIFSTSAPRSNEFILRFSLALDFAPYLPGRARLQVHGVTVTCAQEMAVACRRCVLFFPRGGPAASRSGEMFPTRPRKAELVMGCHGKG